MTDDAPAWPHPSLQRTGSESHAASDAVLLPVSLSVAVLAMRGDEPLVLVEHAIKGKQSGTSRLPGAPAEALRHCRVDAALRRWGEEHLGLSIGHVEQLTAYGGMGARDNTARGSEASGSLAVCYLALARVPDAPLAASHSWQPWYRYMPWEDWRRGRPVVIDREIVPRLERGWQSAVGERNGTGPGSASRVGLAFGGSEAEWNEDLVAERFEVLAEAGVLDEVLAAPASARSGRREPMLAEPDQRILAAAVGRIRARLRDRPVVFDLMVDEFTLFDLQRTVEAILGPHLHKQNFRRLVESTGMIEPTGVVRTQTGGRPAKLFRFRPAALTERASLGLRVRARS